MAVCALISRRQPPVVFPQEQTLLTALGERLRLAVLGLQADFNALAADDKVGRKLQDLALAPSPAARRQRRASVLSTDAANSTSEGQP